MRFARRAGLIGQQSPRLPAPVGVDISGCCGPRSPDAEPDDGTPSPRLPRSRPAGGLQRFATNQLPHARRGIGTILALCRRR